MTQTKDPWGARATLAGTGWKADYYRLDALARESGVDLGVLPTTVKILLENVLRHHAKPFVTAEDILALARWRPGADAGGELPFLPARVVLQDFTGVPAVVDLAAMRSAVARLGGDPERINPLVPADLVIDHSVQVDAFGSAQAVGVNVAREYERNRERYTLLRWGQKAFENFRVVPPGTGIVHQVNLEYLAKVVELREEDGTTLAFPDTLVGTDSHTTMVNGLAVLGWGVGGIEAEAVLLGQPLYMLTPVVVGCVLEGRLAPGATATDLVLTITEKLRAHGVVGKFVEFVGPGMTQLGLADRATISNMAPEYGATAGLFPIDGETLQYLRATGRDAARVELVERYAKEQALFHEAGAALPAFSETVTLDLATVEPSLAGPKRPQDRVTLPKMPASLRSGFPQGEGKKAAITIDGTTTALDYGAVVIAAITSCTNTSNPSVMLGAGLLAKKALARGLRPKPYVKTSLAPGSRVVRDYLAASGLLESLEALRFNLVGYGCTTCIAEGTPVLMADGTARRIETVPASGTLLLGPTDRGELRMAAQTDTIGQGRRQCVSLMLEDGRLLTCTPDHEILCTDGHWRRADELRLESDRVVVGLEAPLDEPSPDEAGYALPVGDLTFRLDTPHERAKALAFARLLGHLLGDGSIGVMGQGRMHVGQAMDRASVLNDLELLTGKRPAATRYDDRKWTIVLPSYLTGAIVTLPGVRTGRPIHQEPSLPAFLWDDRCPVALVREFLGGMFGAEGHAPTLHRYGPGEGEATLGHPAYAQSAPPALVARLKETMHQLLTLLGRCGVRTEGAKIYEYPVRRSRSSYPPAADGVPRTEVRLVLTNGLSFIERVGYRYCVDKALRASAAAVYWRTIAAIDRQRLAMAERLASLHRDHPEVSFVQARELAAADLEANEGIVFPHYSLLEGYDEGYDRFSRPPRPTGRAFYPLHRESCGFPSPAQLLEDIGARDWFAASNKSAPRSNRYCIDKTADTVPSLGLRVLDRREVGEREVFDLSVGETHAFIAGGVAVHNCIGNSGPLPAPVAEAIDANDLVVSAVLSGNRNFEGRIHPQVRAAYLASPPLVVAYALAGTVDIDLAIEPLGVGSDGTPVYLRDVWPSAEEVGTLLRDVVKPALFEQSYASVFDGDDAWRALPVPEGNLYAWDAASTYIQEPPFFVDLAPEPTPLADVVGARVLISVGDSVTTDHISPAGAIASEGPAGRFLVAHGVAPTDFNSFGSRRGNHEVMMRGTFGNVRLRNLLAPGREGDWTRHQPSGDEMRVFEAAERYRAEGTPLVVLAGKEYGTGSSRDWAAKGTLLLGIRAVLAESYERIHRSNLVGMGVLPLQFRPGESRAQLGLDGSETYEIHGLSDTLQPRAELEVVARRTDGTEGRLHAIARVDSPIEVEYLRHGGILQMVLRSLTR